MQSERREGQMMWYNCREAGGVCVCGGGGILRDLR